jgi:hypothetical protein
MPTATTTLGWTLANWGSAPATYTVAPSCTQPVWFAETETPEIVLWVESCPTQPAGDCLVHPTSTALVEDYLSNRYVGTYYSPGTACPTGWGQVGAATHASDGQTTYAGIFTINPVPTLWMADYAVYFGAHDALVAALDPGETAMACCPR